MEPEQRQQSVADELVRLPAGVDHRLRGSFQEAVDQEDRIEWQPRFGELGRAAHVDEHANDITLLADVDAVSIADKIGPDIGRQQRDHGYIGLRSKLARKPDSRVGPGANARKHKCLAAGRPRQRAAIANDTNATGRTSCSASAATGGTLNRRLAYSMLRPLSKSTSR